MPRKYGLPIILLLAMRFSFCAEPEGDLFAQAAKAFNDRFYERAEQQFGEFAARNPASTNFAQAVLLQAQSRFFQRRYEAASELLGQNAAKAGTLGDEYAFWMGQTLTELGNH